VAFILSFAIEEFGLELVYGAASLVHKTTQVPSHARGPARSEDDQKEKHYDNYFCETYTEHPLRSKAYARDSTLVLLLEV
jgi:hypothetical protein